jgi:hypothetical protein
MKRVLWRLSSLCLSSRYSSVLSGRHIRNGQQDVKKIRSPAMIPNIQRISLLLCVFRHPGMGS